MSGGCKDKKGSLGRLLLKSGVWAASSVLAVLLVWQIAALVTGNEYLLPSPWETLKQAGRLLVSGTFWLALFSTLLRSLIAFSVAFVLGVFFAVIAYLSPSFRSFLSGMVGVTRAVPTVAVILLLLVWTGPKTAPLWVAGLTLFPLIYTSVLTALGRVDEKLLGMSAVYRVPLRKKITGLYIPAALPSVLKEGSAAASFSIKLVVSAEVLANTFKSVGGLMQESKIYLETPTLLALTVCVAVIGVIVEKLGFFFGERLEAKWR